MTPLAKKVFELFGKPELAAETESKPAEEQPVLPSRAWSCPQCGGRVRLEPIREDEAPTCFWTCPGCSAWGATRDGAPYPVVWVSSGRMQ